MEDAFPLKGVDGWYPGNETCVICGSSLTKLPQRLRMYVGANSEHKLPSDTACGLNIFWYRGPSLCELPDDIRGVFVFPRNDDPEACIEFCSVQCLRRMFDRMIEALQRPIKWQDG